jgi:predicted ATPase
MITRAKFENFKALKEVEITFDSRLTVLVGPNGSGKTSVLQGIDFVCRTVAPENTPQMHQAIIHPGFGSLPEVGIQNMEQLAECVSSGSSRSKMRLACWTQKIGNTEVVAKIEHDQNSNSNSQMVANIDTLNSGRISSGRISDVPGVPGTATYHSRSPFSQSLFLRLDPLQLSAPSLVSSRPPSMLSTGSGLPSTLAYIKLNQPDNFKLIEDTFRTIIPIVDRVRFDKQQTDGGFGDTIVFDFRGAPTVSASHASNGTLYALGLLTSILGPVKPRIVLLDDLDNGLHPKAQLVLIEVLRKLLDQFPDLQIIATSHSPFILDRLEWNEVRVTALNEDGSAMCKPLTDHPDFERWKESMSPGEFWSTFYEDWLTKTREPQPVP